jgi:NAD(P)-dependent dehydrogenase (short-subunit alcohol dehydrogenase family)
MEKIMKESFDGKTALIFGGSSGIGLEVARLIKGKGAEVIVSSRTKGDTNNEDIFLPCDVTKKEEVDATISYIISEFGKIDILVNSMGVAGMEKIDDLDLEEWNRIIATNLTGVFLTCKAVLPSMKSHGYGKIVNISSVAGRFRNLTAGTHYVASKAGVIGFSRQLAHEVIGYGINVNVVCPSMTLTPMLSNNVSDEDIKILGDKIPIKRLATPLEQAYPILFLCSDESSYMSGAVVDVNGGQL